MSKRMLGTIFRITVLKSILTTVTNYRLAAIKQGMDQRTLQEIMGHQNLALTMKVYNHVDDKRMRDEMDKIDAMRSAIKNEEDGNNSVEI